MAFDASPIASIGDSFDPAASKAKAYQLKDLIDQEQLSQLKLNQAKQGQADTAAVKKLLSKADISTPEGLMKAAQSLTSAGYADQGMQLMQEGQKTRQANESFTETHLKVLQASADIIGPAALQIMDTLKNQGPAMARAQYQQLVGQVLPQLPPELRQKIPAQPPQDDQQLMQLLQGAAQQSQAARQIVTQHQAQEKIDISEKTEQEREKHDRATEQNSRDKQGPPASDNVSAVYAAMADRGVSFPSGMRSVKAQRETIEGLLKTHPEDSPEQIADRIRSGNLRFKTDTTEASVVARREGSAAAAINALNREGGLYDQALEVGKKVDFSSNKVENAWELYKQGKLIADPDLSEYINTLADTRAEFASVLARGGQVTDSVRIAAEHAFPDKMSYSELSRNVQRSKKIADSIQAGNTSVADAIINGKSMQDAMKSDTKSDTKASTEAPTATGPKGQKVQWNGKAWVPIG